jgi:hypothetical protein
MARMGGWANSPEHSQLAASILGPFGPLRPFGPFYARPSMPTKGLGAGPVYSAVGRISLLF